MPGIGSAACSRARVDERAHRASRTSASIAGRPRAARAERRSRRGRCGSGRRAASRPTSPSRSRHTALDRRVDVLVGGVERERPRRRSRPDLAPAPPRGAPASSAVSSPASCSAAHVRDRRPATSCDDEPHVELERAAERVAPPAPAASRTDRPTAGRIAPRSCAPPLLRRPHLEREAVQRDVAPASDWSNASS